MLRIVLATTRADAMKPFTEVLESDREVQLDRVASGAETLEAVSSNTPHLVIIDANLGDLGGMALVLRLMQVNAMVNTAVMSGLSQDEFHEASEGLGILTSLPLEPGSRDAADLLQKLKNLVMPVGAESLG